MNNLRNLCVSLGTIGSIALGSLPAHAARFAFSYTGPGINVSGILTTDPLGTNPDFNGTPTPNTYLITGITGTRNGVPIDGIVPVISADGDRWRAAGGSFDNLIYPNFPFVNLGGFAYSIGQEVYNLFYISEETGQALGSSLPLPSYSSFTLRADNTFSPNFSLPNELGTFVNFSLTQVPEPATVLGILAVGALGGVSLRKRR
ncbi:PEP-CTERM sorting domain-containing protein [Pannus brasiliensis CCIBt3594]|uniref:PEP-CTERM sorting domain-containing protein n=1 Tax=Pannus brasiliensis CCIBt3594 TaxID=1427578 RepID=A0AAW9QZA2_9CHRO